MNGFKAFGLVSSLTLVTACTPAPPAPTTIVAGVHEVTLRVPDGWLHYDHGTEHRFESGLNQISLKDLGPTTPAALGREIAHARRLFLKGQQADARERLRTIDLRVAIPNLVQWERVEPAWSIARGVGPRAAKASFEVVDRAFGDVLAAVGSLAPRDLASMAAAVIEALDRNRMRDVAYRQDETIGGRPALRIDTWDRLSHNWRKRHLIVLNEGHLLLARMDMGEFSDMATAFDALVASLELPANQRSPS